METIDARGLSCPEPVILTRNALKGGCDALSVLVDAVAARENITRFAVNQGYKVSVEENNGEFTLDIAKA